MCAFGMNVAAMKIWMDFHPMKLIVACVYVPCALPTPSDYHYPLYRSFDNVFQELISEQKRGGKPYNRLCL